MSINLGRLGPPAGTSQRIATNAEIEELEEADRVRLDQPKQPFHDMKDRHFMRRWGKSRNGNLGHS